jgi:hypothetical protein
MISADVIVYKILPFLGFKSVNILQFNLKVIYAKNYEIIVQQWTRYSYIKNHRLISTSFDTFLVYGVVI